MAADRNPRKAKNWQLRCEYCGLPLFDDETLGEVVDKHYARLHPDAEIKTRLHWIGVGPTPKVQPTPKWRA